MPNNKENSMNPMNEFVQSSVVHTRSAIALIVKRTTLQFQHLFASCLPLSVCKNILQTPNSCQLKVHYIHDVTTQGLQRVILCYIKETIKTKETIEDLV